MTRALTLWPRLLATVDKDYAAALSDAKTSFDFMLNSSFLSAILSGIILIVGLLYPIPLASGYLGMMWLTKVLAFAAIAIILYKVSIGRAAAWGTLVKGAFDLYRWDLLRQLGFQKVPKNLNEERNCWNDISDQIIFGDSPRLREAEYTQELTYARGEPYVVDLQVTKGSRLLNGSLRIKVTIDVKNADGQKRSIKSVVVTDTLPDGYCYEWDSLTSETHNVSMIGTNPYKIYIGDLDYEDQVTISYRAFCLTSPYDTLRIEHS